MPESKRYFELRRGAEACGNSGNDRIADIGLAQRFDFFALFFFRALTVFCAFFFAAFLADFFGTSFFAVFLEVFFTLLLEVGFLAFFGAAAFTAVDALNGLGLRGFDGMVVPPGGNNLNLSSTATDNNSAAIAKKSALPAVAVLVCTAAAGRAYRRSRLNTNNRRAAPLRRLRRWCPRNRDRLQLPCDRVRAISCSSLNVPARRWRCRWGGTRSLPAAPQA